MNQKIVFFGSGPVAAESLRQLLPTFEIEAVVTKSTTKAMMQAVDDRLKVFTTDKKSELDDLIATKNFKSTVAVLIDFGIIVSNKVIEHFDKGIVNSHFSLLPYLRGADPISFAILEGKKVTAVSLMLLVEAMDEGPIIATAKQQVDESETTPSLTTKLIQLSTSLLETHLDDYVSGKIHPQVQVGEPSYTRKLTKADGNIDWRKPAVVLEREVRAYADWPKSRTTLNELDVIITKASVVSSPNGTPGEIEVTSDNQLLVETGRDKLIIEKLKPAGKKEMDAKSFLAGYRNRL